MEQEKNTQEPVISPDEMKMPEEGFAPTSASSEKTTQLGIILGVLIVLLVLILGGLYLWGTTMMNDDMMNDQQPLVERPTAEQNNEPESVTADAQIQALETVSTSNDINAIEADINSTNLDALDSELNAIDAELDAALQNI